MGVIQNDYDDGVGLRGHMQFNKYTHISLIPPWEDQYKWHRE